MAAPSIEMPDLGILDWLQQQIPLTNEAVIKRIQRFMTALGKEPIHLKFLQSLSFNGIPEEMKSLRPLVWKVLLNYLPLDYTAWETTLTVNRTHYDSIKSELLQPPTTESVQDHPLNRENSSKWNAYFQDQDIWDTINKDVRRTRPDMSFFFMPCDADITPDKITSVRKGGNLFENFGPSTEDQSDFT
jgi:hypothetical protein